MSFCPTNGNTGFVHLAGPLQPSEVKAITVTNHFPLTLSFTPQTIPPTLLNNNQIQEAITHECTYQGQVYYLANIQICSPLHKGYNLPEERPTQAPVAECILTYLWKRGVETGVPPPPPSHSGILLCLPIYESGTPAYDSYLEQIVNDPDISCGYENVIGKSYEGDGQRKVLDTSLRKCVKACCDDTQCLAYTFGGTTCRIYHTIPNQLSTGNNIISGKIKRDQKPACSASSGSSTGGIAAPLSSLFYQKDGKTTHSIITYPTCFESVNGGTAYQNKICVMVFPKGIRMRPASYQQLVLLMNGTLRPYRVPSGLRHHGQTLLRYRMENGVKMPIDGSEEGEVYTTTVSTCTEEFQDRFEYFIMPPLSGSSGSSGSSGIISPRPVSSCKPRTTEQYKCVPFNETTDLEGNIVFPGRSTLADVLAKQKAAKEKANSGGGAMPSTDFSVGDIEKYVGGSIGGIILLYLTYRVGTYFFNRPSE